MTRGTQNKSSDKTATEAAALPDGRQKKQYHGLAGSPGGDQHPETPHPGPGTSTQGGEPRTSMEGIIAGPDRLLRFASLLCRPVFLLWRNACGHFDRIISGCRQLANRGTIGASRNQGPAPGHDREGSPRTAANTPDHTRTRGGKEGTITRGGKPASTRRGEPGHGRTAGSGTTQHKPGTPDHTDQGTSTRRPAGSRPRTAGNRGKTSRPALKSSSTITQKTSKRTGTATQNIQNRHSKKLKTNDNRESKHITDNSKRGSRHARPHQSRPSGGGNRGPLATGEALRPGQTGTFEDIGGPFTQGRKGGSQQGRPHGNQGKDQPGTSSNPGGKRSGTAGRQRRQTTRKPG